MFDTLAFAKHLKSGFTPDQADLLTEAMVKYSPEARLDQLATKDDLRPFATKDDLRPFATRDDLKPFATKDDLERFATKDDLERFATKDDLRLCATKEDLKIYATKEDLKIFATKADLADLRAEMYRALGVQAFAIIACTFGLLKWLTP